MTGAAPRSSSASAYSGTGELWELGPGPIYDRLAQVVVERSPVAISGRCVLDVGAGAGAAGRAALAAGAASVVAVDAARGMLARHAGGRPPAVVGDVRALPFPSATFEVTVAAFSLTHIADPAEGLRQMARVTRPGGAIVVAAFAHDDDHPAKAAVVEALAGRGWEPEPWYQAMAANVLPLLGSGPRLAAMAHRAGLAGGVEAVAVSFPELGAEELVAWRLGLPQHAPFVAKLAGPDRRAMAREAMGRLGDPPEPLVRSVLVLSAVIG